MNPNSHRLDIHTKTVYACETLEKEKTMKTDEIKKQTVIMCAGCGNYEVEREGDLCFWCRHDLALEADGDMGGQS